MSFEIRRSPIFGRTYTNGDSVMAMLMLLCTPIIMLV